MSRRVILAFALAAAFALPAAAVATSRTARTGSFDAMGTGTLVAQGNLRVFGTIEGRVVVRDRAGDAIVKIGGIRQKPKLVTAAGATIRVYTIKSVDGAFFAKGKNVRIELRSPDATLSMSAIGRGRVTVLSGEGTYHVNGGDEAQWTSAEVPIRIAPPPPERRDTRSSTVSAQAGAPA